MPPPHATSEVRDHERGRGRGFESRPWGRGGGSIIEGEAREEREGGACSGSDLDLLCWGKQQAMQKKSRFLHFDLRPSVFLV